MRSNLIIIFLLAVAAALTAIYWKVDRDFFADKLLWNEAQSRSQLSALTRSIESELEAFSQVLDLSFPNLQNSKADYGADQAISRFQMVAKVSEQNGDLKLEPKYFLEGSSVKSWAPSYAYLALKSNRASIGKSNYLLTLLDPKRKAWVLFVTTSHMSQNQYAALLPADSLQAIVDRQKGQMSTLAILNTQSQVLAHTTSEYIGNLFREDPMAQEFNKSGNASGSGIYVGIQGEKVHGFYEQVEGSNLFVTITTPLHVLMAERGKIKIRFLFMGMGISLIGVAMLMLLGGKEEASSASLPRMTPAPTVTNELPRAREMPVPAKPHLAASVPIAPPPVAPIPPRKVKLETEDRFEALFNDRKIQETFAMIDNLEATQLPPPPPPKSSAPAAPAPLRVDTVSGVKIPVTPPSELLPPPLPPSPAKNAMAKIIEKPLEIQMQRKTSKLDQLVVEVRKAGEKPNSDGTAEDLT